MARLVKDKGPKGPEGGQRAYRPKRREGPKGPVVYLSNQRENLSPSTLDWLEFLFDLNFWISLFIHPLQIPSLAVALCIFVDLFSLGLEGVFLLGGLNTFLQPTWMSQKFNIIEC